MISALLDKFVAGGMFYTSMEAQTSCLNIVNNSVLPIEYWNHCRIKDNLVYEMEHSVHSPSTKDQKLDKINPLTVRISYINQHRVIRSKSSTAAVIASSNNRVLVKNEISWVHFITLAVNNVGLTVSKQKHYY